MSDVRLLIMGGLVAGALPFAFLMGTLADNGSSAPRELPLQCRTESSSTSSGEPIHEWHSTTLYFGNCRVVSE